MIIFKIKGTGALIGGYLPTHVLGVYAAPTPVEEGDDGADQTAGMKGIVACSAFKKFYCKHKLQEYIPSNINNFV